MDVQPYLEAVAQDLARATALADDQTRELTGRVATALEPALRLALVQALSDAAGEITSQLDGAVVTVSVEGRDPVLRVQDVPGTAAVPADDPASAAGTHPEAAEDEEPGGDPARVTVRLPDQLKRRAEALAAQADQSLNTWIVQAVRRAAAPQPEPTAGRSHSRRITGWA